MDRFEKKKYLSQYVDLYHECWALQEEYDSLLTLATHITQTLSPTSQAPTDNNHSKVEDCAIKMQNLADRIECRVNNLDAYRSNVLTQLERVKKSQYRQVLRYKYISGLSTYKIAGMLGKSERHVARLINRAIDSIDL